MIFLLFGATRLPQLAAELVELFLGTAELRGRIPLRGRAEVGKRIGRRGELFESEALFLLQSLAALVALPQQVELPLANLEPLVAAQSRLDLTLLGLRGQRCPQLLVPARERLLMPGEDALRALGLQLPLGVLAELGREFVDGFVRLLQLRLVGGDLPFQAFDRGRGVPGLLFAPFDLGFQLAGVGCLPA